MIFCVVKIRCREDKSILGGDRLAEDFLCRDVSVSRRFCVMKQTGSCFLCRENLRREILCDDVEGTIFCVVKKSDLQILCRDFRCREFSV